MKILFVTRDKKPGMIAVQIAKILKARSHALWVIAEGLSVAEWKAAGFTLYAEGPLDVKQPFIINELTALTDIKPDVLVCGLSSPIRIEEACAHQVLRDGRVPLVFLDDNWGAVARSRVAAHVVLTIDALGRDIILKDPRYADTGVQIEIMGDLSAPEAIPSETVAAFNAAKGNAPFAFILASQKWSESDDIITLGLASVKKSIGAGWRVAVIPRFHPGADKESQQKWSELVEIFGRAHPGVIRRISETPFKHNSDHLAALADGIFATTGAGLRAAAYAGKTPLCVHTPRLAPKLKGECGYDHHPLVIGGAGFEITKPTDVADLIERGSESLRECQKELLTPVSFDATKAANVIESAHIPVAA